MCESLTLCGTPSLAEGLGGARATAALSFGSRSWRRSESNRGLPIDFQLERLKAIVTWKRLIIRDPQIFMDDVSSREGKGHIVLSRAGDTSSQVLSTLSFQYPLKLISPRLPGQPCTSVFMMSYGGGLVGGDQIHLSVAVECDTKLCLLTQGSTKIFKQRKVADIPTSTTSQILRVKVDKGGLLALLPDPI